MSGLGESLPNEAMSVRKMLLKWIKFPLKLCLRIGETWMYNNFVLYATIQQQKIHAENTCRKYILTGF